MKSASLTERDARRDRIAALAYDYASQPKRRVTTCNLCGGAEFIGLTRIDRYGNAAGADGCRRCGLVFINPVMTAEAYGRFYVDVYRPLVSAFHGRLIDARTIQDEQREYGADRASLVEPFVADVRGGTLLDVGGSTGVVSHAFCARFGLLGTVIDPSPLETAEARRLGLETVTGLVEQWDAGDRTFDVVVMSQTIDHLLDIRSTLDALRRRIAPHGVFFVDIVDFRAAYLRNWSVEAAVKVDHPYYLTQDTAEAYLRRAGFAVLRTEYAADHLHVSYVCRPTAADSGACPAPDAVAAQWQEIRLVQNGPPPAAGSPGA